MKSMTIGKKISLTCAVLVVLAIISNVVALVGISLMKTTLDAIVVDSLPGVYYSGQILALFKDQRIAMLQHIVDKKQEDLLKSEQAIAAFETKIQETLKEYDKTVLTAEDRAVFEKVSPAHERVLQVWTKAQRLDVDGKKEQAIEIWNTELIPTAMEQVKATVALADHNKKDADQNAEKAVQSASVARWLGLVIMLSSVVLGSALAFFVVRNTNRVLNRAVSELAEGSEQIFSASSQVASSSQTLAQGASEQAASLEETSASSEEITSMTRKNAENSQAAASLMAEVDHHVGEGNRTLEQMVTSMREITTSSDKISKIIKVIDEIAFQTNILALNAAVEAARAGEAGMGFAVVADEVRNLAQRSAQAAKDTAALIEESISNSNEGSTKLQQVTEVIRAITDSATKVKTLVDEVNVGSQEQARGIEQISKAIAQMDQVTQSTAASAEESASASEEMSAQAEALNHVVRQLQEMAGGSGEAASQTVTKSAVARKSVSKGLNALKTAVSRTSRPTAPSSFSMEDDFKEIAG
jgi:methyl-accepting chemotaxis protein